MPAHLPRSYSYPSIGWRWRWLRRPVVRLSAAAAVAAVIGAALVASPGAAADTGCTVRAVGCPSRLAVGLATAGLPRTTGALESLEGDLGRTADVALTFTSFRFAFDAPLLRALALEGRIPMVTWEPWDPTVPDQDRYPLREIAAGTSDAYLRAQAARIREIGRPVALRFAHEMNAGWYPWGVGVHGNTPEEYVAAYRHVHDLFAAEGVRNVRWVWSPAVHGSADGPALATLYPGDEYVDWVGLSVYFDDEADTWETSVAPTVRQLDLLAPTKPLYLAETAVLPGPTRVAMIHDLLGHLLRTPRAIGFTWFDIDSREDWRIDDDPAALDALREEISSPWYTAGLPGPPPLAQTVPTLSGGATVGGVLQAAPGTWLGATEVTGRWLRCSDELLTSCTPSGAVGTSLTLSASTAGAVVRYEVLAVGPGGTTTLASAPSPRVVGAPARPAAPQVEAHPQALRVVFPAPPAGATHWQLRLAGATLQLVPVGTVDYWVTGLVSGAPTALSLTAVTVGPGQSVESAPTSGTVAAMTRPYAPFVSVTGQTVSLTLPRAPTGASGWVLTADGVEHRLAVATTSTTLGLSTGSPHTWALVAVTGSWDGRADGATSPASVGSATPLATPAAPLVTPGPARITLTLPPAPAGTTAWRVTIGPTTYPDLAVGTTSFTATGVYPGRPATWTLRAVNQTARSLAVVGTATALPIAG